MRQTQKGKQAQQAQQAQQDEDAWFNAYCAGMQRLEAVALSLPGDRVACRRWGGSEGQTGARTRRWWWSDGVVARRARRREKSSRRCSSSRTSRCRRSSCSPFLFVAKWQGCKQTIQFVFQIDLHMRYSGLFGLIFPHKMTLHHSELEEPINPGFRKTITNFEADDAPQNHNQLHLVNGVIVPCMLHMMGILFFLRITWAVGVTGWVSTLG